ncbi:MAG: hypothetical protein ACOZB3_03065 [Calditrichota bacterium]
MKGIHFLLIIVLAIIVSGVFIGCDDEESKPVVSTMEIVEAPTAIPANTSQFFTYIVQVNGAVPDCVICEVTPNNGTLASSFVLYDDGGQHLLPAHPYADTLSGDIQARNGKYTRRINSKALADSSNVSFTFHFVAVGGENLPPAQDIAVNAMIVEPCVMTEYPMDTVWTFEQCFDPIVLEVHASASENDEVTQVIGEVWYDYMLMRGVVTEFEFTHESGDRWTYTLTPRLFRNIDNWESVFGNDNFWFEWTAFTRFGMTCGGHQGKIEYVNHLPVLSNSTLPDTAYRPTTPGDSNLIVVTVDMDDCELEGATDFYGLEFETRREDLPTWSRASNFFLRNDGIEPDAVAGDDTYSSWLVITHSTTNLNNLYYFRFYAIDGNIAFNDTSEFLLDSIRIIQPGANLSVSPAADDDPLGIHVWQEAHP